MCLSWTVPSTCRRLLSAVQTALRSRQRQYEIRDHLSKREQAEMALRSSEERLHALVTATSDTLYRMNPDWTEIWHLRSRDFVPDTESPSRDWLHRCIYPEDQPQVKEFIQQAIRTKSVFALEHRVRRLDGSVGWTFSRAIPLLGADGQIIEWFGAASDITEGKRAEQALRESERRFREVLENSLDAAYRRDLRTDTYDYVSPVVKQVFDVEPATLRAMSFDELVGRIHPEDREGVLRAVEEGTVVGSARVEYRFRGDHGQYRWLADHFTVQKDQDGKPISRSGIVRDISDLRRAQDALKEDDRRKDEFLAMLGHELRNPLAAITAGLRLLPSSDSHEHVWVKESLERQTRQLVGLVDDLLDISRITQGKIQLKPQLIDLRTVVKRAAESTMDSMAERQHAFAITVPDERVRVLGDPVRLQQVVANLLTNAAKYTNDGGRIELSLDHAGQTAQIRVKDNGLGIPHDMQETIFDLFGQVDSAVHRPQQGLGIGLNLVKMLVELHNGTVNVRSDGLGAGSEFTIQLPYVTSTAVEEETHDTSTLREDRPLDILLVEDNRDAARA